MKAKFRPETPRRRQMEKSVSFGILRYTSTETELALGRVAIPARAPTMSAFPGPVSNMRLWPLVPRASRLITAPTSAAHGWCCSNALAPSSPDSSASSMRKITSRAVPPCALRARATSRSAATPERSSPMPGPAPTES